MLKLHSLVLVFAAFLLTGWGSATAADRSIHFYRAESPAGQVSHLYPSFHLRDERIIRPPVAVPTAEAYRRLDAARNGTPSRSRATSASLAAVDAVQRRDFAALRSLLVNDFHDVILDAYPAVARAHAALREAGATAPLLSGSGSCLFALGEREADARAIAARFEAGAAEAIFVCALHHDDTWR